MSFSGGYSGDELTLQYDEKNISYVVVFLWSSYYLNILKEKKKPLNLTCFELVLCELLLPHPASVQALTVGAKKHSYIWVQSSLRVTTGLMITIWTR